MKNEPKGTIVIEKPTEPETPEHLIKRIFNMSIEEYTLKFISERNAALNVQNSA